MIKAIIFDFGRVISAQKPPSLFRTYEKDLGLAPGRLNQIMFASEDWQEVLVGRKTIEDFWYTIGPELGLNSRAEIDSFRKRYRSDEEINTGVLAIIQQLKGHYKLAVLSNAPSGLSAWLADWKMLDLFDTIFCSGDEGVVKPDPAAFQITLERLGVKPNEAVFIDDTFEHVEASRKVGLHGLLFTTAEELKEKLDSLLRLDQ
jgi:putative hydrolase of the HAD superfamily